MNEYSNSTNAERGRSRSGFVNALLGAVVMTVFSWIPFAPVVGGALSGYLEAGEAHATGPASRRGIRVGALAGVLVFAFGNVLRRFGLTTTPATPIQAVAINETAALVALTAYALARNRRDVLTAPRSSYVYFTGSGVLTAVALLSMFSALSMEAGRIAIVDPLMATAPLFTTLFAAVLLRDVERVTKGVVVGAALVVVGVVLITL